MSNILLGHIFSNTLSSPLFFTTVFHIRIHLTPEPNKFHNRHTGWLILKLANYFLIRGVKKWTLLWIITIVKLIFILPYFFVNILCLYLITKAICICK